MDKRSATTADRPPNHIAMTIAGGKNMVLAHYSTFFLSSLINYLGGVMTELRFPITLLYFPVRQLPIISLHL